MFNSIRQSCVRTTRKMCVRSFQRYIRYCTRDGKTRFFDTADLPWTRELERNHALIREELEAFLPKRDLLPTNWEMRPSTKKTSGDDRWKTCVLHTDRHPVPVAEELFPRTCELVRSVPDVILGFFSLLEGRKHILPHMSIYAGRLRYHLGIIVPEPREQCRIRVCEETRCWEEGKSLLFDDSLMHEVWNDSDDLRAILIVDVRRPLTPLASRVNRRLLRAISNVRHEAVRQNLAVFQERIRTGLKEGAGSFADI